MTKYRVMYNHRVDRWMVIYKEEGDDFYKMFLEDAGSKGVAFAIAKAMNNNG